MSKPTIYATFGDKIEVFRKAMIFYAEQMTMVYQEALERPTARETVKACLRSCGVLHFGCYETLCPGFSWCGNSDLYQVITKRDGLRKLSRCLVAHPFSVTKDVPVLGTSLALANRLAFFTGRLVLRKVQT